MAAIPKDPFMLVSYVNTQLRDFYPSLEEFCKAMSVSSDGLQKTLKTIGYVYDAEKNQFSQTGRVYITGALNGCRHYFYFGSYFYSHLSKRTEKRGGEGFGV